MFHTDTKKIEERIKWLQIELTHRGYLDGYTIMKYEYELNQLIYNLTQENSLKNNEREI